MKTCNQNISARHRRSILLLNIITPFLVGTAVDLYVPSLPAITHYFKQPSNLIQLTISLYMLGYSTGQIFLGMLADNYGRRKIFILSVLSFAIVSLVAANAPDIYVLNLCRLLQGLSIAGLGVTSRSIIMDCFKGLELTKAMTYLSTSWSLGPIIAPFIGGYIQHYLNWQADFYFYASYGIVIFIYALFKLPETSPHKNPPSFKETFSKLKIIAKTHRFLIGSIFLSLIYGILVIFNMVGPFIIQVKLKYSAVSYGHIALLLGFSYFIGNFSNRFLINYFKPMNITLFAAITALTMTTIAMFLAIFASLNIYLLVIPIALTFIFCGMIFPNMMADLLSIFQNSAGTANAVYGTIMIGGVFATSSFATTIKTSTQLPLTIMYIVMLSLALIMLLKYRNS